MNKRSMAKLQKQCDDWNKVNPVGCDVGLRKDGDDKLTLTKTRSEAQILSGHTAVIWLEGISGCYMLDRVMRLHSPNESLSGGNPSEKSEGLHSDHRGIPQARSSEGGNVGQSPGVLIRSREPVDSNTISVGRLSPEPMNATDNDAAPSLQPFTDGGDHG